MHDTLALRPRHSGTPQAAFAPYELRLFVDAKTALKKQGHSDIISPEELYDFILRLGLSVSEGNTSSRTTALQCLRRWLP